MGPPPMEARHTRSPKPSSDDSAPLREASEGEKVPSAVSAQVEVAPAAVRGEVTFQQLADSWAEILEVVGKKKRAAWAVVFTATPMGLKDDVLALAFPSQNDVENFKKPQTSEQSVSEILRHAIIEVLGLRVKFIAKPDAAAAAASKTTPQESPEAQDSPPEPGPPHDSGGWAVTQIPQSETAAPPEQKSGQKPAPQEDPEPKQETAPQQKSAATKPQTHSGGKQRYGEAVVREILGANFIEEKTVEPKVTPTQEA